MTPPENRYLRLRDRLRLGARAYRYLDRLSGGISVEDDWPRGPYELVEYDDRVEIGIVEQAPNGFRTDDYEEHEATVVLSRPLGSRWIVDATTGGRARQTTSTSSV